MSSFQQEASVGRELQEGYSAGGMERPPLSAFVDVIESYLNGSLSDEDFATAHFELWRQARDAHDMYPQPGAERAISDVFDAIEGSWLTNSADVFPDTHFLTREEVQDYARKSLATLKPLVDAPESPDWPRQREKLYLDDLAKSRVESRPAEPRKPIPTPGAQMIWSRAEREAERLGHWWLHTEHLLLSFAWQRKQYEGRDVHDFAFAVLDEVVPGWADEVTKRLLGRLSDFEARMERLRRERESS